MSLSQRGHAVCAYVPFYYSEMDVLPHIKPTVVGALIICFNRTLDYDSVNLLVAVGQKVAVLPLSLLPSSSVRFSFDVIFVSAVGERLWHQHVVCTYKCTLNSYCLAYNQYSAPPLHLTRPPTP